MPDHSHSIRFTGNFDRLADGIVRLCESALSSAGPTVLALGGYPYTGKTGVAAEIARRWRTVAFVLPTESVIGDRRTRLTRMVDGSSVDAHDVARLADYLHRLRNGETVEVPAYSWRTGGFTGTHTSPRLGTGDIVIVDGSIATAPPVLERVDAAIALCPRPLNVWLDQAIARDVSERSWPADIAHVQNLAKANTVEQQLVSFNEGPYRKLLTVSVFGDDWLVADNDGASA